MIVAITMRLAPASNYHEERDALSHDWSRLLHRLNVLPLAVPNSLSDAAKFVDAMKATRILLTNGDSMGPLPGEVNGPAPTPRDKTEYSLLRYAVEHRIPVLGACRGMQVINVFFGGGLTRDVRSACGEEHVARQHLVRTVSGQEVMANSYHNEGVIRSQVADDLEVIASSPGGVVEGLRHTRLPIWAVQWHPERGGSPSTLDEEIFGKWLKAAK